MKESENDIFATLKSLPPGSDRLKLVELFLGGEDLQPLNKVAEKVNMHRNSLRSHGVCEMCSHEIGGRRFYLATEVKRYLADRKAKGFLRSRKASLDQTEVQK